MFICNYFVLLPLIVFQLNTYTVDAEKIVDEVQKKYKAFENFIVQFTQEIQSTALEGKQIIKAKLTYARENKYRLEYKNQLVMSDGKTIYNYSKNLKRVVITNFEENFFSPQYLILNLPKDSRIEYKGEEKSGKETLKIISFVPTRVNSQFKSFTIWVDNNFLIKKIETEDWAQNKYTINIQYFTPNTQIDPSTFKFNIPAGVKVVDLR